MAVLHSPDSPATHAAGAMAREAGGASASGSSRGDAAASRAVVSFVGGSWTDRLAASCLAIESAHGELRLVLEISPRPGRAGAERDFAAFRASRDTVDSIQLVKPRFRRQLAERVRRAENFRLAVVLRAGRDEVAYPASAVFGPDGITLTFG